MQLVSLNREYIPPYGSGACLYIRPLLLGVSEIIGVKPSKEYVFVIFCTPVGPYFKTGMKPIRLRVEEEMDRAAPNGVGDVKVGGNYAASLQAAKKAEEAGFPAVLYLDPKEKKYIDESGPANFFAITNDNKYVTPKSNSILPSITNKSLMTLAEEMGLVVERRPVDIKELENFKEAGCCGTAAVITPVKSVTYRGKEIVLSDGDNVGEISKKLYDQLTAIQTGDAEDKFGWNKKIPMD
jgi:branched-chain amino acid aminotransferase